MRVALLEASHWHLPLYLPGLVRANAKIVAISDSTGRAAELSNTLACQFFTDTIELLRAVPIDFAFTFGRHCDMFGLATALLDRGIPFAIEKPCSLTTKHATTLRDRARALGLFVAVPFVQRMAPLGMALIGNPTYHAEAFRSISVRFIGGAIDRYERFGCHWMLERATAGGGALINLGIHFVDLVAAITNSPIVEVSARVRTYRPGLSVEEYALVTLATASGALVSIETGYVWPKTLLATREYRFAIDHQAAYFQGDQTNFTIVDRYTGQAPVVVQNSNPDGLYADFSFETLKAWQAGQKPMANLSDATAALNVILAAYNSADLGGAWLPISAV